MSRCIRSLLAVALASMACARSESPTGSVSLPLSVTTFTASPTTVVVGPSNKVTLKVTVYDSNGHVVPNAGVQFAASGGGSASDTITTSGTTGSNGQVTGTLTATQSGQQNITATVTIDGTTQTPALPAQTVTFNPGPPNTSGVHASTLVPASSTMVAGTTNDITLTLLDAYGNALTSLTPTFKATGGSLTYPNGTTTADDGTLTVALSSDTEGTAVVTMTESSAKLTVSIPVTPAAMDSSSTVVPSPSTLTVGQTAKITVTSRDEFGNLISGTSVGLSGPGTLTIADDSGTTSKGTFSTTVTSTTSGQQTLSATVGNDTPSTTITFLPAAPTTKTSTFQATQSSIPADGQTTTTLTLTLLDTYGNPVPNKAVTFKATGTGNTFSNQTNDSTTDSNGQCSADFLSTQAAVHTVTVSAGISLTAKITVTAGAPASGTLTAKPTTLTADGKTTSSLTLTIVDQFANLVPNVAVAFTAADANGDVTTNDTISPLSGTTNTAGQLKATIKTAIADTETVTASFSAGPNGPALTAVSPTLTFVPGPPSKATSSLVTSGPTTADGQTQMTISITLEDAQSNLINGQSFTLTAPGATPASSTGSTTNGTASVTLTATVAGTKTVTLVAGGLRLTTPAVFVPGAPAQGALTFSPAGISDNGVATTGTVLIEDALNNVVPSQDVTITAAGSHVELCLGSGKSQTCNSSGTISGSTNAKGQFVFQLSSTTGGQTIDVTAAAGFTPALSNSVAVAFQAPSQGKSFVWTDQDDVPADGQTQVTVNFEVNDASSNLLTTSVTLSVSPVTGTTLAATSGTTTNGLFSTTLTAMAKGTYTVTAKAGTTATERTTVVFLAGPPNTTKSSVASNGLSETLEGATGATVTVTAKDATGDLLPDQTVVLSSEGGTFGQATGLTNSNGQYTTTFTTSGTGQQQITASIGPGMVGSTLWPSQFGSSYALADYPWAADPITQAALALPTATASPTATVNAPSGGGPSSTVVASPSSINADGSTTTLVIVTIVDDNGNPLSGQAVALGGANSTDVVGATSGVTNANGTFQTTLASTTQGSDTITAVSGSLTITGTVDFTCDNPCGSICANIQTDSNNCGGCGMACGEGEACFSGACANDCTTAPCTTGPCVPVTGSSMGKPTALAATELNLLWSESGGIWLGSPTGKQLLEIASGTSDGIAATSSTFYYSDSSTNTVSSYTPSAGSQLLADETNEPVDTNILTNPQAVVVGDGNVYWANYARGETVECSSSGDVSLLDEFAAGGNDTVYLATDATYLYDMDGESQSLYYRPLSGGGRHNLWTPMAGQSFQPGGVAAQDGVAYWIEKSTADQSNGTIMTIPVPTTEDMTPTATAFATGLTSPTSLLADSQYLYWIEGGNTIMACPLAGCGTGPLTLATLTVSGNADNITQLTANNECLFAAGSSLHVLSKMAVQYAP